MNLFQSSNRALSIGLIGLKEAFMAVAERVARRVQAAKLQLQADDTEARLRQAYESLGQCLYTTHTAQTPETLKVIDAALGVIERGTWTVADAVDAQPWLPNGPIPLNVAWTGRVMPSSQAGRQSGALT